MLEQRAHGVDAVRAKPYRLDDLQQVVARVRDRSSPASRPRGARGIAAPGFPSSHPRRIGMRVPPWRALFGAALACLLGACTAAPAPAPPAPAAPAAANASASATGASSANSAATPPPRVRLRVPHSTRSAGHLTFWLPYELGLFAQHGLDVETDYIPTSTVLTQGLLAGEFQLASSSQEATVSANLAGGDIVLFAAGVDRMSFSLYARPELSTPAALRGARLGVTRFGTGTDFAARSWLRGVGLEAERDVPLLPVGGQPELWAALESGAIDAAVLAPPLTGLAARAGFVELVDYSRVDIPFHLQAMVAQRRFLAEQPATVRAFLEAYAEGIARLKTDPELAREALARFTGVDDPVLAAEAVELYRRTSTHAPRVRAEAIRAGLAHLALTNPAAADAPPERFYELGPLDALEQEGILARLGL
jgi:NitT/TauT family transport system substrate-binding protein